jgi:hypothetical protein
VIVSKLNHEANTAPWVRIAERLGLTVKFWASSNPTNPTCDVGELKTLLSDKTRLVACPHASNITGTISPIREIADAVHMHPRVRICIYVYPGDDRVSFKEDWTRGLIYFLWRDCVGSSLRGWCCSCTASTG